MSQENVELVRRGVQDVEAFWAMLDEHVVWDMRATGPPIDLPEVVVGRDAVIEASRHYWGTWTDYRLDAEELIDAGASVSSSCTSTLAERGAGYFMTGDSRRYARFTEGRSSDGSFSWTRPPPSKPSDFRSRGCRRRTSNGPTERRTQSPGATSMLSSYSATPIWSSARSAGVGGGRPLPRPRRLPNAGRGPAPRLPRLQRGDRGDTKPGEMTVAQLRVRGRA